MTSSVVVAVKGPHPDLSFRKFVLFKINYNFCLSSLITSIRDLVFYKS